MNAPTQRLHLIGGSYNDTLSFQYPLGSPTDELTNPTSKTLFGANIGGAGNDTLHGSTSASGTYTEDITGQGGNDTCYGYDGSLDGIYGGDGDDDLFGGDGIDIMYGGDGQDFIRGGAGSDTLYGGDAFDEIRGDAGNDTIFGEGGPDIIQGDDGNDTIDGGDGNDIMDLDRDGNCLADDAERRGQGPRPDRDGDGLFDPHGVDDDNDGAPDILEMYDDGCADRDTDGDRIPDRLDEDSDGDGILDVYEAAPSYAGLPDSDGDGKPDLRDLDSDDDGFLDADESGGTSPPRDTDDDGRGDWRDRDNDNDGLADDDEVGLDPLDADSDHDGARDGVERWSGTDPADAGSRVPDDVFVVNARTEREQTLKVALDRRLVDFTVIVSGVSSHNEYWDVMLWTDALEPAIVMMV